MTECKCGIARVDCEYHRPEVAMQTAIFRRADVLPSPLDFPYAWGSARSLASLVFSYCDVDVVRIVSFARVGVVRIYAPVATHHRAAVTAGVLNNTPVAVCYEFVWTA